MQQVDSAQKPVEGRGDAEEVKTFPGKAAHVGGQPLAPWLFRDSQPKAWLQHRKETMNSLLLHRLLILKT